MLMHTRKGSSCSNNKCLTGNKKQNKTFMQPVGLKQNHLAQKWRRPVKTLAEVQLKVR